MVRLANSLVHTTSFGLLETEAGSMYFVANNVMAVVFAHAVINARY